MFVCSTCGTTVIDPSTAYIADCERSCTDRTKHDWADKLHPEVDFIA